ncbi:MAG TPA: tyrosine-type recombinase/integrase [Candidatus Baltobacteraceae bacterium]|nr:tyrosine-type recombinase/integrase [Candidatus Baltobacteraceae bacterium]
MGQDTTKRARYGDGSIYRRGNVLWIKWREVRRRPDGIVDYIQHAESTRSDDRRVAQRKLRAKLVAQGGRRPTAVDPTKTTYEDLRENYLAQCEVKKLRSLKRAEDDEPTLATLPRLDLAFGTWRAADITTADLKRFRAAAKSDGLSDARTNRYMATIRAMFNQGLRDELLTRAEVPAYFPMVREPNEARGAIFIEPGWYKPLRKRLQEPLRSAFTLAYHTGMRVHEMLRLRWKDVNVETNVVTLPGEITKTGKSRLIPLPAEFGLKPGKPDALVFPVGNYRWAWYAACVAVGAGRFRCDVKGCGAECRGRTCPTHGERGIRRVRYSGPLLRHTRHTAVRNMSDAGLPETRIMAMSGHVTRSMFDRYNIGREKDVAAARDAIERFHRAQQKRAKHS